MKRRRIFRFEDVWSRDDRCEELVRKNLEGPTDHGYNKVISICTLGDVFKEYMTGVVKAEIKRVEELLKGENIWSSRGENIKTYKGIECQRNNLLKHKDVIWREKSRKVLLKDGDRNTKFFHGKSEQRRKTNPIKKLKDEDGQWWKGKIKFERLLPNYFSDIY
ncbi:unnamed protein product [Vicia faba]|uniref:Uncharacterized protein n=1 Tax=Vicia faba TaxID=3906 RepID=A0AAV1BA52_VICFA|nr:unnamed protein product [Vicia faba]